KQELERGELIRSSDRNIAASTAIAVLIFISVFLWGASSIGLALFVAGGGLGLLLIWLVVRSGKY
ncbi:MAG TPA: hypothetical protein VFF88_02015, partial [Methylocella sp.]|nr:hypothetical protein [Methylocella sp.]